MNSTTQKNITIRRSDERGKADHGWLVAKHSFSFADYYDPAHMAFRSLRVINEDRVAPGKGFGTHPHSNMEIFTYIISGKLEHKDSMGNGRIIEAGQFQYMSAGEGVMHSELNPSPDEETHLLQIWITPRERGGEPKYADMDTHKLKKKNNLTLFASADGRDSSISMRQDAEVHFGQLDGGQSLVIETNNDLPHSWIQMIRGSVQIDGETIQTGDAASFSSNNQKIHSIEDAEFILFQLS
ncbi:MAG: pirin family protein [Akkermansiaceae bacterium]